MILTTISRLSSGTRPVPLPVSFCSVPSLAPAARCRGSPHRPAPISNGRCGHGTRSPASSTTAPTRFSRNRLKRSRRLPSRSRHLLVSLALRPRDRDLAQDGALLPIRLQADAAPTAAAGSALHAGSARGRDRCRWRNVFLVSMGDMFGRWVPDGWVEAVLREVRAAPQWNFLGPPFRRASNTSRALPKSAAEVRKGRRSCQTTWLTVERSPYMRGRCLTPWSGWRQSPSEDLAAEARRLRPDVEIMIRRTVGPA